MVRGSAGTASTKLIRLLNASSSDSGDGDGDGDGRPKGNGVSVGHEGEERGRQGGVEKVTEYLRSLGPSSIDAEVNSIGSQAQPHQIHTRVNLAQSRTRLLVGRANEKEKRKRALPP